MRGSAPSAEPPGGYREAGAARRLRWEWALALLGSALLARLWPHAPPPPSLSAWALLLVAAPVAEELLARDLVQRRLERLPRLARWRRLGVSGPNLVVAALFAAAHAPVHPGAWLPGHFAASLALGHFWERHRDVRAPIALHAWFNAVFLWL